MLNIEQSKAVSFLTEATVFIKLALATFTYSAYLHRLVKFDVEGALLLFAIRQINTKLHQHSSDAHHRRASAKLHYFRRAIKSVLDVDRTAVRVRC